MTLMSCIHCNVLVSERSLWWCVCVWGGGIGAGNFSLSTSNSLAKWSCILKYVSYNFEIPLSCVRKLQSIVQLHRNFHCKISSHTLAKWNCLFLLRKLKNTAWQKFWWKVAVNRMCVLHLAVVGNCTHSENFTRPGHNTSNTLHLCSPPHFPKLSPTSKLQL